MAVRQDELQGLSRSELLKASPRMFESNLFERLSPLNAADTIRAPLLLLNCLEDWRCPVEQGEQLYTALKKRGCTVEMVCFPGEGHTMLSAGKPRSRVERRRHILRWFEQYLIA